VATDPHMNSGSGQRPCPQAVSVCV